MKMLMKNKFISLFMAKKKYITFLLIYISFIFNLDALTLYSRNSGVWSDGNNWSTTADGLNPVGGTLIATDNHDFRIYNGDVMDFAGYNPNIASNSSIIRIYNGQLFSSGSFDISSQRIIVYKDASINITNDFNIEYLWYRDNVDATSISISVGDEFSSNYIFTSGNNPNYDITSDNVTINNLNYYSLPVYQGNDIDINVNITSATGEVRVNSFFDSGNSSLIINSGDLRIDDTRADVYGTIAVDGDFNVYSSQWLNVHGDISATNAINVQPAADLFYKSGSDNSSTIVVMDNGDVEFESGSISSGSITVQDGGDLIYLTGSTNSGTIEVENNGDLDFETGSSSTSTSAITVQNGGDVLYNGGSSNDGSIIIDSGGTVEFNDGSSNNSNAVINNSGILNLNTITNEGSIITKAGGLTEDQTGANTISGDGTITVENGGTLQLNNNSGIDTNVYVESGGTLDLANMTQIGGNAYISIDGDLNEGAASLVYTAPTEYASGGTIVATGDVTLKNLTALAADNGGVISANSIDIVQYGDAVTDVDVYFNGNTDIETYLGPGFTEVTNGNLVIQDINITNGHVNISVPGNGITVPGTTTVSALGSLETHSNNLSFQGDVSINAGASQTLLYADNQVLLGSSNFDVQSETYIKGDVIQQGNVFIPMTGDLYVQDNWDSNTFNTIISNSAATFQIDGNATFDNVSGSSTAGSAINILGNASLTGTGNTYTGAGAISIGGLTYIDNLTMDFSSGSFALYENDVATYDASGLYNSALYNPGSYYLWDDDSSPNKNNTSGHYASKSGGNFATAGAVQVPAIAPVVAPLPVTLLVFSCSANGGKVIIHWETLSEHNSESFVIRHYSDKTEIKEITTISAAGNSDTKKEYSFEFDNPVSGINYFSLEQIDNDGSVTELGIRSVFVSDESMYYRFNGNKIQIFTNDVSINTISVYKIDGTLVGYKQFKEETDYYFQTTGIYIVKIESDFSSSLIKIIAR